MIFRRLLTALCIFAASLSVMAQDARLYTYQFPTGYLSGMADNGRWALYKTPDYDEEDAIPRRLDLEKGIIEELPLDASQTGYGQICVCRDITDDGELIVGSYNSRPAYYKDGKWTRLPVPAGLRGYTGDVYSVTPDGSMMCGWISNSFTDFKPVLWKNGELVELTNLPTYEEMRDRGIISREDYNEHRQNSQTPNLAFFKISADGKQVLSGVDHNYPGWGASYIVYHVESDTYDWIADDSIHGDVFVDGAHMSNNGEWISAGISGTVYNPDGSWDNSMTPARYHVPTGTFERTDAAGIIDNNGVCYGNGIPSGSVYVPIDKILSQKYGINFYARTGFESTGWWLDISSDTRTLVGQPGPRIDAYSITLPVPLVEAAEGVNLLDTFECFPADGASFSRLRQVQLRLPYPCRPKEDAQVSLRDSDGHVVATTQSITGSGRVWVLEFPETLLEPSQSYEVILPEGLFRVEGHSSRSVGSSISYRGRKEEAVKPYAISPVENSAVIELGLYNMVTMSFSTTVIVSDSAEALLYEKGAKDPIGRLALSSAGTVVYAYPAATRRLSKGREYEVRIMPGSLTDITGFCPNEEIVIEYRGAYQATAPDTGSEYLFFDDFSSPNESLGNFLLYEGDHRQPNDFMKELGFDMDNTPWNFSVHDEEEYDYCAASTSMYIGGGAASDWMSIPQLSITNPYNYLTFRSQSYAYSAADRLKVIVWECDEVLGSLSREIIDRVLEEGTVVYDERQLPGENQERLAGDWRQNEISLADFDGKKIYILFLNDNDSQSMVFVDDVTVVYRGNYTFTTSVPSAVVGEKSIPVSAKVGVIGDVVYDTLSARLSADGDVISEVSFDALTLAKGDSFEFTFPDELPLSAGKTASASIEVTLGQETRTLDFSVKNLLFETEKRVLVEEGTGSWCGWCPLGIIAFEYLNETYPGRVAEVAVHNGDSYAFPAYDQFLNLGAYPMGRVNRGDVVAPFVIDEELGAYSLTSASGQETFVDKVEEALATPADIDIRIIGSIHLALDCEFPPYDFIESRIELTSALDTDADYNLLLLVTEDRLPGFQSNYLAAGSDPLFGWWMEADDPAMCLYNGVARQLGSSGFYGDSGLLPTEWNAGEKVEIHTSFAFDLNVDKMENAHLVAALISPATGEVVNVAVSPLEFWDPQGGVDSAAADIFGRFTVTDGQILFNGDAEGVEVFNLQGQRVTNSSLHGLHIARCGSRSARIFVR